MSSQVEIGLHKHEMGIDNSESGTQTVKMKFEDSGLITDLTSFWVFNTMV
jgi:hypothetical protein